MYMNDQRTCYQRLETIMKELKLLARELNRRDKLWRKDQRTLEDNERRLVKAQRNELKQTREQERKLDKQRKL